MLIALGLGERLAPLVMTPQAIRVMAGASGRQIMRIPLGVEAERRYGAPYWTIHRGDLQSALAAAAQDTQDIELKLGARVEDFAIHANGVTAQARSGGRVLDERGVALIGADGVWSTLSARIQGGRPPRFRHRTAWRTLVPANAVPEEFRAPLVHLWLGHDAHLVHYPVKGGRLINIVGIVRDEWKEIGWSAAGNRAEILRHFARFAWAEKARALIAIPEQWLKWALYDRKEPFAGGRGPVTLIGDAAHPMLPFLAQGAGMAIEDAAVLADMLGKYLDDPADALRAYEGARWHRTASRPTSVPPARPHLWAERPGSAAAQSRFARDGRRKTAQPLRLALYLATARTFSERTDMIFPSTVAGSLPKPSWLAEPNKLWPQWRLQGDDLAQGKLDATLLAIKLQEDAGIDIVCDGEMSRQHFVHGFLEFVDGIDFAHKVEMGIRADRYKAMVPVVRGALTLKGRVHQAEARHARAHTKRQLKITLPGPMTISDTIADAHYGDKVKMAMAFAGLLNQEARALASRRRRRHPVRRAGLQRVHGRSARLGHRGAASRHRRARPAPPPCTSATATASRPISIGKIRWAANGGNTRRFSRRSPRAASSRCRSKPSIRACR